MGFIREKERRTKFCDHLMAFDDYCNKCGAPKNRWGVGYESRLITVEEEVTKMCTHLGEFGTYCSKCGDKIKIF